jgi:hypothetical protein
MPLPNLGFPQVGNNMYQQLLQQYQQNLSSQNQVTVFYNVPSEEVARRWDVTPNNTVNFINTNEGYIYIKSAGNSILEPAKFTRIRLTEETDTITTQTQQQEQPVETPQVNLDNYITKTEFEERFKSYDNVINDMQEVVKELKG